MYYCTKCKKNITIGNKILFMLFLRLTSVTKTITYIINDTKASCAINRSCTKLSPS